MINTLVSGSNIIEMERRAVENFSGATKNMAEALQILWAIKEGELWKEHLVLSSDGSTEPAFTNFATGYLPYFLETYGPVMGMDYSAGWVLAKFRLYGELIEAGVSESFEDALRIKNQYTVEQYVRQLESQGEDGKQAARDLLRQAVGGSLDVNSLRQEAGLYAIRYVVVSGTRKVWIRLPEEGDFFLGDFSHLPDRAWLSLEHKLKLITVETGEGY